MAKREIKVGDALRFATQFYRGGEAQPNEQNAYLEGWNAECERLQAEADAADTVEAQEKDTGYAGFTTGDQEQDPDELPNPSVQRKRFGRN